ncbi:MAG: hypothetical protein KJP17_00985, partial [Gammaproteobacteria bacterium]|nr:hypothetical protein [Gammaproteobacteria bacterium]
MSAEERELGLRERSELARRRGVISGKEFIQRVKAWAADPDTNPLPSPCFVKGVDSEDDAIDLRGLNCERPLNLRDFCFLTTVDLRDARVAGPLDLRGSTFLAGLRLGCCRLEGGLDLSHCWIDGPRTFGAEAQAGPAGPVDLHGAIIEGSLVGNALQVRGSIDAESMRVKANCELSGLILGFGEQGNATKNTADLVFRGARIEGQLVLHRANIEGQLNLQSARIDLDLFIRRGADEKLRIGTILATFAQSGGDFDVDGAEVSGEVNVLGGRFGRLFIEDCQIGTELVAEHVQSGNVVMTNLLVEQVRLSSSSLSGDLNWNQVTSRSDRGVQVDARGLSLDNLYMSNSSASELFLAAIDAVEIRISDTTATEMTLSNARLSGDLFLTNVSSLGEAGTVIYARGLSAHNIFIEDGATGELNLASANVLGDFIWRPRNIRHCPVRRLDAGNLGVGGYCVLDAVQCDGVLDFSKARLGALRIRCYPTQEDDVDSLVVEPSTARSLVGRNMVVDGDVELYGLQVGPGESIANKEPGTSRPDNPDPDTERDHTAIADGVIDLSNAEIRGDLKFWSHELASQLADSALSNGQLTIGEGGRSALYRALCGRIDECLQKSRISRYLRLAGTEVRGNLVLTGLRVGTGAPAESDTDGLIDLADAEIRRNVDTRTRDRTATTTLRTACRRLSLRGMRCSGDLYLQRLSITQPSRLHTHESAIDGQRVRVDG